MSSTSSLLLDKNVLDFLVGNNIKEKYEFLSSHPNLVLFERKFFGPFEKSHIVWDISEEEKIVLNSSDVNKLRVWIIKNIIVRFAYLDYKTLDVLMRIATGMLNKCDISKNLKIKLHDNLVWNLRAEHNDVILSELPF